MMIKKYVAAFAVMSGFFMSSGAHAVPISYEGELMWGVAETGQVGPFPDVGDWWYFSANAGDEITITANRLEPALDPTFDVFFGFGDTSSLTFVGFGDDEIPELPGMEGPYNDAELTFTAAETGLYSINVWSFASGSPGFDGVYDYQIVINRAGGVEVPEPASLGLLGAGLLGLGALRRRKA